MLRILKIELRKIVNYVPLWVLFAIYLLLFIPTAFTVESAADFLMSEYVSAMTQGQETDAGSVLFSYQYIWYVLSFLNLKFAVFLSLIIVTLVTNEFQFRTLRQNIIDGMSRLEVLLGKQLIMLLISLISGLFLFVFILVLGEQPKDSDPIPVFEGAVYVIYFMIGIFGFMNFAYLISSLFKNAGLSILGVIVYWIGEWIVGWFVPDQYERFLPANAIGGIIPGPTEELVTKSILPYPDALTIGIALGYIALFVALNYWVLLKGKLSK